MPYDISIKILVIFFIGNLFRSAFGTGGNLFIASVLGLTYDLKLIVPYLTIMLLLNRLMMLKKSIPYIDYTALHSLLIGAILGSIIGGLYLYKFSESVAFRVMWGLFLIYNSLLLIGWLGKISNKFNTKLFQKAGIYGFIFGVLRSAFGAGGGPILALYYGTIFKDKERIRANLIASGVFFSICQSLIYFYLGLLTPQVYIYALVSLPILIISTYLGEKLFSRMNSRLYHIAMMIIILFSGIATIIEAIMNSIKS